MSLPRVYYTLPELAEKWKRPENDLLQMAAAGELVLSVKYYGFVFESTERQFSFIDGYVQLYAYYFYLVTLSIRRLSPICRVY
jgi:hypothetical protein